uniref:B30.2/SPRY domain-containing protein n=1 Tax=Arcella intermedia TaxID=1963864 RepID=A0A6B2LN75_9EUKA
MDPFKTFGWQISKDGLTIRHDFNSLFGSSLANVYVTKGKWYYEVLLITDGLMQIGWANKKFVAAPAIGKGVGDENHSWAVDLNRKLKWHQSEFSTELPYGHVTWVSGGIVQFYLDLDERRMGFGYNGQYLGDAFEGIEVDGGICPAVSGNLENEIQFNFGETPFK